MHLFFQDSHALKGELKVLYDSLLALQLALIELL